MLRVYLPFLGRDGDVVRWSRYVDVEAHSASLNWFDATDGIAEGDAAVRDLTSCMGELDPATTGALREAIGGIPLRGLRWMGYGDVPTDSPTRVFGEDYFEADLTASDIEAGRRIPEFAWDAEGRLAWGSRLYPDSLIIAADSSIFRRLSSDPRIDTVSVRKDRDILPGSAGD